LNRSSIIKAGILIIWIVLLALLIKRDVLIETIDTREIQVLDNAERQEFQGIYFKNKKIGYVKSSYTSNDDHSFQVEQKGYMVLNILETSHPVDLHLNATLNSNSRLKNFSLSFKSPFYRMTARGEVKNKQVRFTLTTNSSVIHDTVQLGDIPMLSTTRRGFLLRKNMAVGDKIKVPWFDPISLTGKDSIIEYRGKEKILINKRIFNLHHFLEKFNGARINIWLDDEGKVVKEESPAGFVFIREPEFKATRLDKTSSELLSAVAVQIKGKMTPLANRQSIRYKLQLPDISSFNIDGGRQSLTGNIVTLHKERIDNKTASDDNSHQDMKAWLLSTPYIQVNHPEITKLRQSIIGQEKNRASQVNLLADWVYNNIEKRPVVGLPDALTTLKNRTGDCNEHAALFTALARNSNIPTRFVAGVTYHLDGFYYHAWNEVYINDQWVSLDTTKNQLPADLGHIRFVEGGIKAQLRIGALLGQLGIEVLPDAQQ